MERAGWPQAVVAVALILTVGGISIAAIVSYESVDDALKFWSALSGLVGIITGAFVTYFFSRGSVQQAQQQAEEAKTEAKTQAQQGVVAVQALTKAAGEMSTEKWDDLKEDPTVVAALEPRPTAVSEV